MTVHLARNGWTETEKNMLMEAVQQADQQGSSLRSVFSDTGERLGRKPNSVRNYYYLQLRNREGRGQQRAAPFVLFTENEVHDLVKEILLGKSRGRSVRSCVTELSQGDKTVMLRLQNKYRSVLKKRPDLIRSIVEELEGEGVQLMDREALFSPGNAGGREAAYQKSLEAMDRMRVQTDMMRMQLEDMQSASRAILLLCKDYLALLPEEKQGNLDTFCRELTSRLTVLENAAN